MANNPALSIYEAAIILDAYLYAAKNNAPKMRIAKHVSEDLRQMARNSGVKVDDSYRSVRGITGRMFCMECAYTGINRDSVQASELSLKIVDMYRNDRSQYDRVLNEARAIIAIQVNNKEQFINWVCKNAPDRRTNWIESNL